MTARRYGRTRAAALCQLTCRQTRRLRCRTDRCSDWESRRNCWIGPAAARAAAGRRIMVDAGNGDRAAGQDEPPLNIAAQPQARRRQDRRFSQSGLELWDGIPTDESLKIARQTALESGPRLKPMT